jgi:predicted GNAT family acetyltransferase
MTRPGCATVAFVGSLLRRTASCVEHLSDDARDEFTHLVDREPFVNAVISARLRRVRTLDSATFGGDVLAVRDAAGRLAAAAVLGSNLLPVGSAAGTDAWRTLGEHLGARRRMCTSIVGSETAVAAMWPAVAGEWGPARAIRRTQPLLVLDRASSPRQGDPRVRAVRPGELERYLPAAAAMFAEELGVAPERTCGRAEYRRRVAALIADERAFAIFDRSGAVLFKADLGAVSPHTCQVHGVWVRPELRGQGIGGTALATVVQRALTLAPTVSLYVNDFNTAARRMYTRLGMREVTTLSTVLF